MLAQGLALVALLGAASLVGLAVSKVVPDAQALEAGDRVVFGAWIGLLVLGAALLTVSLLVPLRPVVVALVFAGALPCASFCRSELRELGRRIGVASIFSFAALLLSVSFATAGPVTYYDTGLYHYPLVRWLSQYGAVPGLGLLHHRFAFPSVWLALPSAFEFGIFQGRLVAVPGAAAWFLSVSHLALILGRMFRRTSSPEDAFFAVGYLLLLPLLCRSGVVFSPSPDLPVAILVLLVAGFLPRRPCLSLVLASGAFACKTTGATALLVAAWRFLRGERHRLASLVVSVSILLPVSLYSLRTSGCLLFPLPIGCTAQGVGAEVARELVEVIRAWARTGTEVSTGFSWVVPWLVANPAAVALFAFLLGATVACLRSHNSFLRWPLLTGAIGSLLYFFLAPDLRFFQGYAVIGAASFGVLAREKDAFLLPALLWPLLFGWLYAFLGRAKPLYPLLLPAFLLLARVPTSETGRSSRLRLFSSTAFFALLAGLFCATLNPEWKRWTRVRLLVGGSAPRPALSRLVVPPSLPVPRLRSRRAENFAYVSPKESDQCWASPVPCTPFLPRGSARLRSPSEGLAGGFARSGADIP